MNSYKIKENTDNLIKHLLKVARNSLNYRFDETALYCHIGITSNKKTDEVVLYPLTYEGERLIECYLGLTVFY